MQHLPVGMEMFNASSDSQWKVITDTIDDCDYYILILGKRYGSLIEDGNDKGMSYTEREFRYAMKHGVPCIGFLVSDKAKVISEYTESDPQKLGRLNEFRKLVESHGTVNYWKNEDELATQVRASLDDEIKRHPRDGWIRCNQNRFNTTQMAEVNKDKKYRDIDCNELLKEGIDVKDEDAIQDYLLGEYEKDENGWYFKKVPDGEHIRRSFFQELKLEEGIFKNNKLLDGVSYNWIVKFWKTDADENEHENTPAPTIKELTDDNQHEDIQWSIELQYGGDVDNHILETYLEHENLDKYYVADKTVYSNGKKIKLYNIRTIESFLAEHAPKVLKYLQKGDIEPEFDEEVETLDFSELMKEPNVK